MTLLEAVDQFEAAMNRALGASAAVREAASDVRSVDALFALAVLGQALAEMRRLEPLMSRLAQEAS